MSTLTVTVDGTRYVSGDEHDAVVDERDNLKRTLAMAHMRLHYRDPDAAIALIQRDTGWTAEEARAVSARSSNGHCPNLPTPTARRPTMSTSEEKLREALTALVEEAQHDEAIIISPGRSEYRVVEVGRLRALLASAPPAPVVEQIAQAIEADCAREVRYLRGGNSAATAAQTKRADVTEYAMKRAARVARSFAASATEVG